MSRSFTATSHVLKVASLTIPAAGALSFLLYPTNAPTDGEDHVYFDIQNASPLRIFHMEKYTDNNIYIGWYNNGNDDRVIAEASGNLLQNAWNHVFLSWAQAGKTYLYINNTLINAPNGTDLDATWDTSAATFRIGNPVAENVNASTRIAEFAVWSSASPLIDKDVATLNLKASPLLIKPLGLLRYWPMIGFGSAEPDAVSTKALSVTGAAQAAHPLVTYRRDSFINSIDLSPSFKPYWASIQSVIIQPGII